MPEPTPPLRDDPYQPPQSDGGLTSASSGNGMALASLVCGLMCCVTPVPAILGIAFGMLGLKKARNSHAGGSGMSIAGLSLGGVGLVLWILLGTGFGYFMSYILREQEEARKVAESFVKDLSEGKIDAARAQAFPEVETDKLATASRQMEGWGWFQHLSITSTFTQAPSPPGELRLRFSIEGGAIFSRATREISLSILKDEATYKVERFSLK